MNFKKNGLIIIFFLLKNIISLSEISITIKGTGNQKILNSLSLNDYTLDIKSSHIYINDILQNYSDYMVYDLTEEENNITMMWDNQIENCNTMFYSLTNVIKMDLSKFDSSKVTIMKNMLFDCISLSSIIFDNFDTHLVRDMEGMFYNCISLTSINLTYFDTSSVTSMERMFAYCISLKTLDLSNFATNLITDIGSMFFHCEGLLSLDISSFRLDITTGMSNMFSYCNSLLSLDLRNFTLSTISTINMENMFEGLNNDIIFCFDENLNSEIITELESSNSNYINNCSDICFHKLKRLKKYGDKVKCKLDCIYNEYNKFEYNDTCYDSCPIGTHNSTEKLALIIQLIITIYAK